MIAGSLAKRYARALFELAQSPSERDKFLSDVEAFTKACKTRDPSDPSGENDLGQVLDAGHHPLSTRRAIMQLILKRIGAHPTVGKFLDLVLDRGRISGIEQIYLNFRDLTDHAAGRVRATVTTATKLDPASAKRIEMPEPACRLSGNSSGTPAYA